MEDRKWTEKENPLMSDVLPDDSTEGHEKRLSRYADAKARQMEVISHILQHNADTDKPVLLKEQKALDACGSFLLFRHYYEIQKYRLLAGCTCKKHLLCALCAIRRAAKCVAVFSEKIKHVTEGQEYEMFLITLTIKNRFDLAEGYDHLTGSFKKLLQKRKNALKARPTQDTPFKHVAGAIYSYEVTIGQDDTFHPHVHMIALVPSGTFKLKEKTIKKKVVQVPVDLWAGLVQDWEEITGDSKIIDVRKIQNEDDQISALVETFKYALKFSEMDVAVQVHCYMTLRTRRMIGSMGALFGVKLPDNLNDELLPGEEKYVDLLYQYSGINFGYQLLKHSESLLEVSTLKNRYQRKAKKQTQNVSPVVKKAMETFLTDPMTKWKSKKLTSKAKKAADQYRQLGLYVSPEEIERMNSLPEVDLF